MDARVNLPTSCSRETERLTAEKQNKTGLFGGKKVAARWAWKRGTPLHRGLDGLLTFGVRCVQKCWEATPVTELLSCRRAQSIVSPLSAASDGDAGDDRYRWRPDALRVHDVRSRAPPLARVPAPAARFEFIVWAKHDRSQRRRACVLSPPPRRHRATPSSVRYCLPAGLLGLPCAASECDEWDRDQRCVNPTASAGMPPPRSVCAVTREDTTPTRRAA
ncbi:hypothetical protein MRX96_041161 [Rhipicephalus microplus]